MKRKIKALVCAVLMVLTLASPQMGATAQAATVYYTAMNDSLLELSDETMPFWYGSYLYLPASSVASTGMGVSYVYNTAKQTVVLYSNSATIIFDLAANTAMDQDGKYYGQTCVRRNGRPFVPASTVAKVLGLSYSNIKVNNGYLVRLCSDAAVLTDSVFSEAAQTLMDSRYRDYIRGGGDSQAGENLGGETGTDTGSHRLYLSLTVTDAQSVSALVSIADAYGGNLLFFLTEELLFDPDAADAVRQLVCSGCDVGLYAEGEDAAAQLAACNERLFAIANRKTRLVRVSEDAVDAAESAGYCVFHANVTRSDAFSSAGAPAVLDAVGARNYAVKVHLGSQVKEDGLRSLLSGIRTREYAVLRFTEVTV